MPSEAPTLVRVLARLRHESVAVELKDGTVVRGTVRSVDREMNLHLRPAVVRAADRRAAAAAATTTTKATTTTAPWTQTVTGYGDSAAAPSSSSSSVEAGRERGPEERPFEEYRVRGNTVRYVVLPDTLNIDALLGGRGRDRKSDTGRGGGAAAAHDRTGVRKRRRQRKQQQKRQRQQQ